MQFRKDTPLNASVFHRRRRQTLLLRESEGPKSSEGVKGEG